MCVFISENIYNSFNSYTNTESKQNSKHNFQLKIL